MFGLMPMPVCFGHHFLSKVSYPQIRTDDNLISILWSQPVSAQQIMIPNGEWRWVKHVDNAAVCRFASIFDVKLLSEFALVIDFLCG